MTPREVRAGADPSIRPATELDAEALVAIYAPVVRDTAVSFELEVPSVDAFAQRVRTQLESTPWLVLEDDAQVLAFAYGTRFRGRPAYDWCVETSIYVDAGARRRGVARRLYSVLLQALALQGFRTAVGVLTLPNPPSVALHEALGFEATGTVPNAGFKHDAWHDVGFWTRTLGEPAARPGPLRTADELFADPRFAAVLAAPPA